MGVGERYPPARPSESPASDPLDSWKEIATYLKRGVRTVQRWEREESLPVHRHIHEKLGRVYAYKVELDAWWRDGRARLEQKEQAQTSARRQWLRLLVPAVGVADRKSTRLNSSHIQKSRMPSSA